jgi:hypothetical protein
MSLLNMYARALSFFKTNGLMYLVYLYPLAVL